LESGFEFGEQEGAFVGRASAAHQAASGEGVRLAGGRNRVAVGEKFSGGEWFRVPPVNIQGVNERRAFQDDPHAGMPVAVDSPFVRLGVAKPAFQVEIVLGQVGRISSGEESGLKAAQHLGHLLPHAFRAGLQLVAEDREPRFACRAVSLGGIQGRCDRADHLDVALNHG
jgi:hypothetical protein